MRPHRYAALVLGVPLFRDDVVEHLTCDHPVCARAELGETGHVWPSTQGENLRRMGQRARGGGAWWQWRWSATDRATLAARSRAQRDAVSGGWDPVALQAALEISTTGDRGGRRWITPPASASPGPGIGYSIPEWVCTHRDARPDRDTGVVDIEW